MQFVDAIYTKEVHQYKEIKKTHRLIDDEARREAARAAKVEEKHSKFPLPSPDLHAMLQVADAVMRVHDLPAHTMESFLQHLHMQVNRQ